MRRRREKFRKAHHKVFQERQTFLKTFNATSFEDFSAFNFGLGHLSCVFPFPELIEEEWRYRIHLRSSEAEDTITLVHEISECTLGRIIERLLSLQKPLYLQRKENNKFWLPGKKQKYLVEHVMTTLGEVDDLTHKTLRERLNKEEIKAWLSP